MLMVIDVPQLPPALHFGPDQIGAVAFAVVAAVGLALYWYFSRKPDPAEIERQRRLYLAQRGRITDATLVDTSLTHRPETGPESELVIGVRVLETEGAGANAVAGEAPPPAVLQYQYRVAGVGYESSQDVSLLAEHVRHVRLDLPIQVRYDPGNPGNSIVVSEVWSGLRLGREARTR